MCFQLFLPLLYGFFLRQNSQNEVWQITHTVFVSFTDTICQSTVDPPSDLSALSYSFSFFAVSVQKYRRKSCLFPHLRGKYLTWFLDWGSPQTGDQWMCQFSTLQPEAQDKTKWKQRVWDAYSDERVLMMVKPAYACTCIWYHFQTHCTRKHDGWFTESLKCHRVA